VIFRVIFLLLLVLAILALLTAFGFWVRRLLDRDRADKRAAVEEFKFHEAKLEDAMARMEAKMASQSGTQPSAAPPPPRAG